MGVVIILSFLSSLETLLVFHGSLAVRLSQAPSKFQETNLIVWWIAAQQAYWCDRPVAALDGEDIFPIRLALEQYHLLGLIF
jgi:hypothetical protein